MKNFYKLLFFAVLLFPVVDAAGAGFVNYKNIALAPPVINGPNSVCAGQTAQLSVTYTGTGTIKWYSTIGGPVLHTGTTYTTPALTAAASYYAELIEGANAPEMSDPKQISINSLPIANFTFSPSGQCASQAITFTNTSTGSNLSYQWDFGDSTTSTDQNPTHTFIAPGVGNQTFTVILTATNTVTNCIDVKSHQITVKKSPDSALNLTGANGATTYDSVQEIFLNCDATSSSPQFTFVAVNNSSTTASNTSYTINWGDGISETHNNFNTLSHPYSSLGFFNITLTTYNSNTGCSTEKIYKFFNGNTPGGNLAGIPNTSDCVPYTLTWPLENAQDNTPGTTYKFYVNDGSAPQIFTQANLPPSIEHTFTQSSCGIGLQNNKFTVTLEITNPCGQNPTTTQVQATQKPIASFNVSNEQNICANTPVVFTNNSIGNYIVGNSCNSTFNKTWSITPNTGWNLISGQLNGTDVLSVQFTQAGNYSISLNIKRPNSSTSRCTEDIFTKTICVKSPLSKPTIAVTNILDCSPLMANASVTSALGTNNCDSPITYLWSVRYVNPTPGCGSNTPQWSYTGSTNQNSVSPSFSFVTAGEYYIKVTINNGCGGISSDEQKVVVKQKPLATLSTILNVCGSSTTSITPTVNFTNCGTQAPIYAWSSTGTATISDPAAVSPTISYTSPGTYTVSVTITNECGAVTDSKTFTISPPLTVDAGGDKTICAGGTGATLNGSGGGGTGNLTYLWSPSTGLSATNILNPVANPSVTTTYTLKVIDGSCSVQDQVTVTVNTLSAGVISSNQTICNGGDPATLTETTAASGAGTLTYQWEISTAGATTGYADIAGAISATYDPPGPLTQQTWYRRKVTSTIGIDACTRTSNAVEININNVTAGSITDSQVVCTGGDPLAFTSVAGTGSGNISYQWQSSTDNVTFSNIGSATSATYDAPALTQTTYYKRIAKSTLNSVACTAESNVITVTVKPDPVVDTQPQATQTVCQNGAATALTITVSGGEGTLSYQWYSNAIASTTGAVPVSGAIQANYTPLTGTVGTKYYYVVVSQSGLGCQVTSAFAEVIVTQSPQITTQPVGSAICQGGTVTALTVAYSNGTGTPSYQWFSNATNSNTSGSAISGATASTYTPPSNTVGILYYYAEITFGGGGGCAAIKSATAAVTVSDFPAVTVQPAAQQEICVGGSIPPLTFTHTGGAGTASYKWYSNTTASTSGGTVISGATSQSYTPPVYTTAGTYYYYAEVTFSGSSCGAATTAVAIVTVVPDPVIGAQPIATQTWCENATPQNLEVSVTGGSGTLQYQWYSNTANSTTGGTSITGATLATYTPPTNVTGTQYYYCIVTTPASGCSVTSAVSQVIVNPAPTFTTQPQGSTVCVDGTPTLLSVTYSNGTGTPTYQWYESATPANSGGIAITTATNATYQPEATTAGTKHYYCVITFSSVGCNSITSQFATVTVNPDPTVSTQPLAQQEICVGGIIAPLTVAYTDGVGTPSYQWYSNTTASNSGGTGISGATSATFTPTTNTTPGNYYFYAIVTLSGSGCGSAASDVSTITVVADPVVTSPAFTPQTLCEGATVQTLAVTASGGSGTTYNYQWFVNNANNNTGGTAITGETNSTYTPLSTPPGTKYYYCEVGNPASGCLVKSSIAEIVIMPAPAFTTQPQSGTVCQGQTPAVLNVAYTNGTGTASYQWFSNVANNNTGGALITGANNATYQPSGATVGTTYYYAEITFSSGGCQVITSNVATVTIDPLPSVTTPQAETICSGSAFHITPVDGGGNYAPAGTTYTWSAPTGTGFTGGSAQATPQSNISQTLINTTTAPVTATYMVTPRFNSCIGNTFMITITINPTAVIADVTRTICSEGTFTVDPSTIPAASIPAGTTYSWNAPVVTGGLTGGTAGTGQTIITGSLNNPTTTTQTATYTVTPTSPAGNCSGNSFDIVVTVRPQLQVTQVLSNYSGFEVSTAGGNDGEVDLTPTGGSGAYTYLWSGPNGFTSTQQDVTGLIAGTYTVTISDGLCSPIVLNILIREPLPLVIQEVLVSHVNVNCFGQNTGVVEVQITQASIAPFDYIISVQGGAAVETVMNLNALNYVFDNLPAGTYEVKVVDANGTVKTIPGIIITQPASGLSISNAAISSHNGFSITCNGANNGSIDLTVTGGYPAYTYSWTGPNGFTASTQDISGLSPGSYTVVIGDTTGVCTITQTYTITEPQPLTYTGALSSYNGFGISCSGGSDGTIIIIPVGGTGTYNYQWLGPNGYTATTQNLTGLFAGTYTLTVTDSNGCVNSSGNYTLTEPASMVVTETHTNLLCFGASTGSIITNVSGGVPGTSGYAYLWTGPNGFTATTQNLSNVAAGAYTLVVTDSSGCTKSITVTLTQPTEIIITATTTPISCYGANDATITLAISGGVGPYQAAWDNFASGTFQQNLAAGTYQITVTDGNNCPKIISVVIPEAPIFTINPVHRNISCHGANDGSIVLNFVGGQAPITLVWSDGSTSGTSRHNLPPGVYTVTITDSKPCVITRTFVITEPQPLLLSGTVTHANDCNNAMSGAVNLLVSGGMPPFTYAWSNGATTEDLIGITSGNYSVTVTDANGCTNFRQFTVTRPQPLEVSVTNDISFDCATDFVRQVNTATASGGVLPYHYAWSAGTVSGANGQTMSTNNNGMVTVTVTDGMGCTAAHTFEIDTQQLGDASFGVASYAFDTYGIYSIVDPIQFTNTSTGDYISVAWDFGDGAVSTENNPVHAYQREGQYIVTQTVTYPYSCVERNTFIMVIEKGYDVMIPTGFTPNGDGVNDQFIALHRGLKSIEIKVYDTWGSMIYYEKGETLHGWDGKVNGVESENGNYYYNVTGETFYGHTVNFEGPCTLIK